MLYRTGEENNRDPVDDLPEFPDSESDPTSIPASPISPPARVNNKVSEAQSKTDRHIPATLIRPPGMPPMMPFVKTGMTPTVTRRSKSRNKIGAKQASKQDGDEEETADPTKRIATEELRRSDGLIISSTGLSATVSSEFSFRAPYTPLVPEVNYFHSVSSASSVIPGEVAANVQSNDVEMTDANELVTSNPVDDSGGEPNAEINPASNNPAEESIGGDINDGGDHVTFPSPEAKSEDSIVTPPDASNAQLNPVERARALAITRDPDQKYLSMLLIGCEGCVARANDVALQPQR